MLVFLGLAYLFTKTPVFTALVNNSLSLPDKVIIYFVFAGFSILGTVQSEPSSLIPDAIANTRAIGAVLGGLLGGPLVGFFVGFSGGLYRLLSMSCIEHSFFQDYICGKDNPASYIDIACVVSTTLEGLFAGCVHFYLLRKGRVDKLFSPWFGLLITLLAESGHMLILLLYGGSEHKIPTLHLINEIALPMLIANSLGVAVILYMIKEQKNSCDVIHNNAIAWRIANKTAESMFSGFHQSSQQIAEVILAETNVSAVSITDKENVLAFTGQGRGHHLAGSAISNAATYQAIEKNKVIFIDGIKESYHCELSNTCKLGSALIIPLQNSDNEVFGTIKLYEAKAKLFRNINKSLGKTIAQFLSTQFLLGDKEQRNKLEAQEQLKLLRAQINPHFLYNALATIASFIKQKPEKARDLLQNLSDFFRANLKAPTETNTLGEEYKHLQSYLEIEKARYDDNLQVELTIPENLMDCIVPVFTLQPIVENAIEHGTSQRVQQGIVSITASVQGNYLELVVKDNAGMYKQPEIESTGIGLTLDKRIKLMYGKKYGLSVDCKKNQWTKFTLQLPILHAVTDA